MTQIRADIEAFMSVPIRLAALFKTWRRRHQSSQTKTNETNCLKNIKETNYANNLNNHHHQQSISATKTSLKSIITSTNNRKSNKKSSSSTSNKSSKFGDNLKFNRDHSNHLTVSSILNRNIRPNKIIDDEHESNYIGRLTTPTTLCSVLGATLMILIATILLINLLTVGVVADGGRVQPISKHSPYYLDSLPASIHFNYAEGRQSRSVAEPEVDSNSDSSSESSLSSSMIRKRSSALLPPGPPAAQYLPLVSSMHMIPPPSSPFLSRRIMMLANSQHPHLSSTIEQRQDNSNLEYQNDPLVANPSTNSFQEVVAPAVKSNEANSYNKNQQQREHHHQLMPSHHQSRSSSDRQDSDRVLLRQKQHIQYHDQWPSLAGKCHKRTLNFCASVLPFNTTTFPNIIGDTNRFEVKRSLPFFGFLAKSSCNKRLDELLCLLLEPPCHQQTGLAIPPCKKFCRLALEGCNEYIPATLALSSVFDCRQYPDSNDPGQCINLAQGSKCSQDEFKCPDETCIPRSWLCDGVRDCVFAADEANCTDSSSANSSGLGGPAAASASLTTGGLTSAGAPKSGSICSTEEFKCDAKCVPKAWKCDGERDCLDGTDEEDCERRPRCGADRFRCADGNGCIPKRWVCDGKAECRDGSDEMNCAQRECSQNDFKCDNGICIPNLWRCDRQFDCKDGSDERGCTYPEPSSSTSTTTTTTTAEPNIYSNASLISTEIPATIISGEESNIVFPTFEQQQQQPADQYRLSTNGSGQQATNQQHLIVTSLPISVSSTQLSASTSEPLELPSQAESSSEIPITSGLVVAGASAPPVNNEQLFGQPQQQQLESSLVNDVTRIIQKELVELNKQQQEQDAISNDDHSMSQSSPAQPTGNKFGSAQLVVSGSVTRPDASYDVIGLIPQHHQQQMQQQTIITPSPPSMTINNDQPQQHPKQADVGDLDDKALMRQQMIQMASSIAPPSPPPAAPISGRSQAPSSGNGGNNDARLQPQAAARIPIYRNLFKSLKAGSQASQVARHLATATGPNDNPNSNNHQQILSLRPNQLSLAVPGSRRRRERYQLAQQMHQRQQLDQQMQQLASSSTPATSAAAAAAVPLDHSQQQQQPNNSIPEVSMQTNGTKIANSLRENQLTSSVSNYLQLLNSRYQNLRLNRVHH